MKRASCLLLFLLCLLFVVPSLGADFSFEGKFLPEGSEPVWGEKSYQSPWVNFTITTGYDPELKTDITVADIYIRSTECLRRVFRDDTWGKRSYTIPKFAKVFGAPLTMSGDSGAVFNSGLVVANGHIWQNSVNAKRDIAVIWKDGRMECFSAEEMVDEDIYGRAEEIWHTFMFGPRLLDRDGNAYTDRMQFPYREVASANPRGAIGYFEPGHYCLVHVAGRKTKSLIEPKKKCYGADLVELSQIMADLGCKAAYNLDGGQSAVMCFREDIVVSAVKGGRPLGDAIIVCDPTEVPEE